MPFVSQLFATTDVDKLRALAQQKILKRALTAKDLVAIGLGTMIGGGIFTTIGIGVVGAGPAVIVSYLLAGLTSFFAALCYAELGAMVPVAGSAYTYAYATLGKLFAWIIGFALIFEYGISAAPVASQFSSAFLDVLRSIGIVLPAWATVPPDGSKLHITGTWWMPGNWDLLHSHYDIVGAIFVIALSVLLSIGIRESANVFIIAGAFLFNPSHFANFAPHGLGALQPFGGMADYSSSAQPYGIIAVSAFVFFSYIGFDTATTTAEECKDPQRDVPLGVMGALVIGTVIYCATAIVLIGAVPWNKVPAQDPLVYALRPLHMPWVSAIITVGVLAGTTSVALSSLLGQARIFYVMARDKMLPPAVAKINPRFKTPMRTTMITGIAVAILTLIVPLTDLLNLVNIGTLAAFTVVCGGVIYLRRKRPDLPRSFKVPFVPLFPILGIVLSAFLAIFGLSAKTWTWFVIALLVGLVFFFSYGFRKSKPEEIEPVLEPEGLSLETLP
jgi:APA family basic amino acid/polyamine antiporter